MLGGISVILSIICFCLYDGGYESSYTYGGDAYTGIQNASAQAANNLINLADIVKFGFGSVLLIGGLYLILSSVFQLLSKPVAAITPAVTVSEPGLSEIPEEKAESRDISSGTDETDKTAEKEIKE